MPQQQEELSVEVSGLSVGLNSGSTAASGSNSSGPSATQHNSMSVIPRALSPPLIPRAPIRLVYSRRQRNSSNDNVTSNMANTAISSGSQKKGTRGKESCCQAYRPFRTLFAQQLMIRWAGKG
ncbi:hypothetical protein GUJ93_ZPchr0004g40491 [Zizania palustris]|uniref:Uncharacterized protein n=1 Tax=Zizania palustris TaxID=103762 RepID=A0A8J5SPX3_ZIZPA|nr:hypothetical protein GUJ93_ZPchr0004g40491 [Zizania palustris]